MKFSEVRIGNLQGVGDVELRFDETQRVFTLFGTNGVGKTKCLEALYIYLLMNNPQVNWFPAHSHEEEKSLNLIPFSIFDNASHDIDVENNIFGTPCVYIGAGLRSENTEIPKFVDVIGNFESRNRIYWGNIKKTINEQQLSSIGMANDVRAWVIERAHSASTFMQEKDNRGIEIEAVVELLHKIDDSFDQKFVQMDGNNCVYVKIDGEKRELKELSSGFISLLKIVQTIVAGYAAQVNENNIADVSGVVLIDEIESHLHVEWQSKIVLLLKKIFPNTIFYIATHSPIVLSQLAHGEAYLLKKDEDGVVRTQMIEHPNNKTIYDVINTGFDVNLNSIKIKNSNLKSQTEAKRILLELLDEKAS